MDEEHIVRDRRTFTKQMLRSYIKNTVNREAWNGAPWIVKQNVAEEYRISTEVPAHLRYENKVAERKAQTSLRKGEYDGTILSFFSPQNRLPELKPKSHKSKNAQNDGTRTRQEQFMEYQRALAGNPSFGLKQNGQATNDPQYIHFSNNQPTTFPILAARGQPRPPPPAPVKYPIEDLEVPPVRDGTHRPALKYLSEDTPTPERESEGAGSSIAMESVGPLLETWNTLNVYCEVFQLDFFTFDDYIEALQFASDEVQCELLVEIHCAVLKRLVNDVNDKNGQVQIVLPAHVEEESEEEESTLETSTLPTPTPEPEVKPVGRTTRSSLAKSEAAEINQAVSPSASSTADVKQHRAAEFEYANRNYDWKARLQRRDFKSGKWIVIIVGLLNQLSGNPRLHETCDEILAKLAPLDQDPTNETVISQYASLDINLRVKILQILCMSSLETKAIRGFMEECAITMTEFRKEKIEYQRARKMA